MRIFSTKIIALGLAGVCFFAAGTVFLRAVHAAQNEKPKAVYQCSMHPWVVSDKPGNCPICGMKLTRAEQSAETAVSDTAAHAGVVMSSVQEQLIGVKTEKVLERPLTVKVRALGRVGYDHDQFEAIAHYQEAAAAYKTFRGSPSTQIKERAESVHELSMLNLRLAGLSDEQIESLTHLGQLPTHFTLPDDTHWIYADLYEEDSNWVHPGDSARVTAKSLPGKIFPAVVKSVDAFPNKSRRVVRARIQLKVYDPKLKSGNAVDVVIHADLGKKLSIPHGAAVDAEDQQIVFVRTGQGAYEPRAVNLGAAAQGYDEVVEGLKSGEEVVSSGTFLVDSESRLRAASRNFKMESAESENASAPAEHRHGG